jgi:hypothetical protein
MAFSYRNTYTSTANLTTYTFSACDLGALGTNRLVVVGVNAPSNQAVSSITVDGASATLAITSGSNARLSEIWYASTNSNATGDIVVTFAGAQTAAAIHVWAGYPASATPVDAVGTNASASSLTLSNVAKTSGGFTVMCSKRNDTSDVSWTQNGAETITEDHDSDLEAANGISAASHANTATTTTDDYTATFTGSTGCGAAIASWGPEAKVIVADAGSFTLTGTAVSLELGRKITAGLGTFELTGTAASLERGLDINADTAAFTLTGADVTLTYFSGIFIEVEPTSFEFTPTNAALEIGRKIVASTGTFSLSGTAALLEYGREIAAGSGAFALTGMDATLSATFPPPPFVRARVGATSARSKATAASAKARTGVLPVKAKVTVQ